MDKGQGIQLAIDVEITFVLSNGLWNRIVLLNRHMILIRCDCFIRLWLIWYNRYVRFHRNGRVDQQRHRNDGLWNHHLPNKGRYYRIRASWFSFYGYWIFLNEIFTSHPLLRFFPISQQPRIHYHLFLHIMRIYFNRRSLFI